MVVVVPDTMLSPVLMIFLNELRVEKCTSVRIAVSRRSPRLEKQY